jgi:hypothetical protein
MSQLSGRDLVGSQLQRRQYTVKAIRFTKPRPSQCWIIPKEPSTSRTIVGIVQDNIFDTRNEVKLWLDNFVYVSYAFERAKYTSVFGSTVLY